MTKKTSAMRMQVDLTYCFVLLALFVFTFWVPGQKMVGQWDSGDNNYAYLVFPMFLYLCWEMRETFRFGEFSWSPWGLVPIAASLFVTMLGNLGSVITLQFFGIWLCIVGIVFILYGKRAWKLTFPLLILVFIIPMPPFVNRMLTFQLKLLATKFAVIMLRVAGVMVLLNGNIIDLGNHQLQMVDACSGLRYFVPLFPTALLIGYFYARGWWRRLLLLVVVPPIAVLINTLRVFIIGILTDRGHQELTEGFFHDFFGWVGFMVAAGILLIIAMIINKVMRHPSGVISENKNSDQLPITHHPALSTKPTALILTIVCCLLFAGTAWALNFAPGMTNLPGRKELTGFPMEIQGWQGKQSFLSQDILAGLSADDYVEAAYQKNDGTNLINLLVPFYEYQGVAHTAHAPQSCMLGSGWGLSDSRDRNVEIAPGETIRVRSSIWTQGDTKLLGVYFFLQRGRVITSPWMNKFYLMYDAFTKRRTDGALVRMEMPIGPKQSVDEAERVMDGFIADVWPVLGEYVPE